MSCEASYLLLRTPARRLYFLLYSLCTLRRPASSRFVQAGGVREGGRRILRRPMQPISNRSLRGAPMAMANRRAVSGSAAARCVGEQLSHRGSAGRGEQRSRAAEQERRRHSQIARERISGVRSSGESHGRRRRTGALASSGWSGRKIRISYEEKLLWS